MRRWPASVARRTERLHRGQRDGRRAMNRNEWNCRGRGRRLRRRGGFGGGRRWEEEQKVEERRHKRQIELDKGGFCELGDMGLRVWWNFGGG